MSLTQFALFQHSSRLVLRLPVSNCNPQTGSGMVDSGFWRLREYQVSTSSGKIAYGFNLSESV